MKVRINKFVKVDTEVDVLIDQEVDVCMEDVVSGFFNQVRSQNPYTFSGNNTLSGLLDRITKVLSLIPDEKIRELSPEMRSHHRHRLNVQAERFWIDFREQE